MIRQFNVRNIKNELLTIQVAGECLEDVIKNARYICRKQKLTME